MEEKNDEHTGFYGSEVILYSRDRLTLESGKFALSSVETAVSTCHMTAVLQFVAVDNHDCASSEERGDARERTQSQHKYRKPR